MCLLCTRLQNYFTKQGKKTSKRWMITGQKFSCVESTMGDRRGLVKSDNWDSPPGNSQDRRTCGRTCMTIKIFPSQREVSQETGCSYGGEQKRHPLKDYTVCWKPIPIVTSDWIRSTRVTWDDRARPGCGIHVFTYLDTELDPHSRPSLYKDSGRRRKPWQTSEEKDDEKKEGDVG